MGVILVVAGIGGRMSLLVNYVKMDVGSLVAAHQLSLANYVAHDIEEKIGQRQALLKRLAARLPVAALSDPSRLALWLRERQDEFPLFSRGYVAVRGDGAGILGEYPGSGYSAPAAGHGDQGYRDSDWFQAARNGAEITIGQIGPSGPGSSGPGGEKILVMAAPVRDEAGRVVAVLAGRTALSASGFLDLVQEKPEGETGGFLLVSPRDGVIVAASDSQDILKPMPSPGVNALFDLMAAGSRGTVTATGMQGDEELAAIVPVPVVGWVLVAHLPAEQAFRSVAGVRHFIIVGGFLTGGVFVLFVAGTLPRFFRPLTDASRQMRRMADGEIELTPLPIARMDEVGDLVHGFNHLLDKLRQNEERMAHMAHHDALTGLPNRAMFEDRLYQAAARAERSGAGFGLLFIDLDGFKPINDRHGHKAGDEVLRLVAVLLASALRRTDTVARIGGDEFAILLEGPDDIRAAAVAVAGKCVETMAPPMYVDGITLHVGLSIGIACYPEDGREAEHLLAAADRAMYAAKNRKQGIRTG